MYCNFVLLTLFLSVQRRKMVMTRMDWMEAAHRMVKHLLMDLQWVRHILLLSVIINCVVGVAAFRRSHVIVLNFILLLSALYKSFLIQGSTCWWNLRMGMQRSAEVIIWQLKMFQWQVVVNLHPSYFLSTHWSPLLPCVIKTCKGLIRWGSHAGRV